MVDIKPIGIDQTTGQQRAVASNDSLVNNIGNQIQLSIINNQDYSGNITNVTALYPWDAGYQKLDDPASVTSNYRAMTWSPGGEYFVAGANSGPDALHIYQRTGSTLTLLSEPASQPSTGGILSTAFSTSGEFLAVGTSTSGDRIAIYQRDGSSFTKLATPASIGTGTQSSVAWSPGDQYLAVASAGLGDDRTPYLRIWERDGTTFTKLDDPASLPASLENAADVAWSPDGRYLALATALSPFLRIYQRENTTFTILPEPNTLPTGTLQRVEWSPDGQILAAGTQATQTLFYEQSGNSFTLLDAPASMITGQHEGFNWSPSGKFLAVGVASGVGLDFAIYQRDGTTFTLLANPETFPGTSVRSLAWSPDEQFLIVSTQSTPTFLQYQAPAAQPDSGILVIRGSQRAS